MSDEDDSEAPEDSPNPRVTDGSQSEPTEAANAPSSADADGGVDGTSQSEDANAIQIFECSEKLVGIYYDERTDGEYVFQSIGDTREDVVEDMIETLTYLPQSLTEIDDGEAGLVEVVQLERKPKDEGEE